MDYKTAGVDVEAGRAFVSRIRSSVEATFRPEVVGGLGGFGGMMRLPAGMRKPLLVSGTDGVGTKLELAQDHGQHHNVGIDLVAMCVNDVITTGAAPLFFLDYMATGALSPEAMAQVVEGIADGCRQSGCSLLGGETAEMPGFYPAGRYDLAGFCVAVVEEDEVINGQAIQAGDRIVGVASNGVHSNGFSLVRKVLDIAKADANTRFGPEQAPLIEALLAPTTLYGQLVQRVLEAKLPSMAWLISLEAGSLKTCPAAYPLASEPPLMPTAGPDQHCSAGFKTTARSPNGTSGTPSTWALASAWCFLSMRSPTPSASASPCTCLLGASER